MDELHEQEQLRRALDTTLSGLRGDPWLARRVLTEAKGEGKVKKKLSMGFVLVIVLVLAAVTALAVSISRHYFEQVTQIESAYGAYDQWPLEQKEQLLSLMREEGVLADTSAVDALLADGLTDEAQLDAFITARYGIDGRSDVITVERMAERELGARIGWTQEQKAWYDRLLAACGLLGSDTPVQQTADAGDISQEEAIRIARADIQRVWGLTEDDLSGYIAGCEFSTQGDDTAQPYYYVWLEPMRQQGQVYHSAVSRGGVRLTSADAPRAESAQEQRTREASEAVRYAPERAIRRVETDYAEAHGYALIPSSQWPLADYKAMTDLKRAVILQYMEASPDLVEAKSRYLATHFYGVPGEEAITLEEATAIALQEVAQQPLQAEIIPWYELYLRYYDVTDPDKPLWKLTFGVLGHADELLAAGWDAPSVLICVDALSGAVVRTQSYRPRAVTEEQWAELIQ